MIETYQLEQLVTFAEYKTLSKAAEVLHISQPSLSRTMQQLEAEMGVTLFERQKNRLALNENGQLAVTCAKKVLEQLNDMTFRVRSFDRVNHTISIGSCAPIPGTMLTNLLRNAYPEMTLSSEIKSTAPLMSGLMDDTYQFIILPEMPEYTKGLYIKAFTEEHLMFSLPKSHPKATEKSLHLSDINGQNMIVMPNLGFWRDIIDTEMPDSRFSEQTDRTSFEELIQASVLPYFITNLSIDDYMLPKDRVVIPIVDDKVNVTFYLVAKEETHRKYFKL
ncbi:LysR family transcriptional regulator [Thermoguttaceae bacterium LCP21S3_D4]